jgi:filamentous hemagglutinin
VSGGTGSQPPARFLTQPVEVSARKIRSYLLDAQHRDGGSKARFFVAKGFSTTAWREFAAALVRHSADNPIRDSEVTNYGVKVTVQCVLRTPDGSNPCIRSIWMVEGERQAPRLVTAYPSPG